MKPRHIIFSVMITALVIFGSCADNATDADNIKPVDSPAIDSLTPAHVKDPSTAFPQPPVTGSQTDSSRTQDSAKKKQ